MLDTQLKLVSSGIWFFKGILKNAEISWNLYEKNKDFNIDSIIFEIRKQDFIEKLSEDGSKPEDLVECLQDIEKLCSTAEYNNLWFLLHLNKPTDQAEYKNWNKMKGRLNWFTKARPYLSMLYDRKDEKYLWPSGRMLELMKYALSHQYYISQQENEDSKPKYCSLLKDLVEQKTCEKFNSQHLKEFSLSFSKKCASNISSNYQISEDSLEREKYTERANRFNSPRYWKINEDDDYVAHTIDLDERKENIERGFYSDQKLQQRNREEF